jgi:hypothetical protein
MFKNIVLALSLAIYSISTYATPEVKPETKKVCQTQKDAKGVEKQVCKNVKIHKKL